MLHIVNQSPFHANALVECLRFATNDCAILLIEDGVYAAMTDTNAATLLANSQSKIYALKEDIFARGLKDKIASHITIINYADFVDLTINHPQIQTWS